MELKYINKSIIAAVAQRPFTNRQNTFCKLLPVFNHIDPAGVGFSEKLYNDNEIWWLVRNIYSQNVIPGMLVEVTLEAASQFVAENPDSSAYQAQFVKVDFGSESGAEMFDLYGETEKSMLRFKGNGATIKLPHVPTRVIFIRAAGFVYGPFSASVKDITAGDLSVQALVAPFQSDHIVFRIGNEQFAQKYQIAIVTDEVSNDKQQRSKCTELHKMSWQFLVPAELRRMKQDCNTTWQTLDFESLAAKISHLANSIDGFGRGPRQNARKLIEHLEQFETKVDDPAQLQEAIKSIAGLVDSVEQNVRSLVQVLIDNDLIQEAHIEDAKNAYLRKWIETKSNEINLAIEAKQKELDALDQRIAEESRNFEFDSKRREKALQDKIDSELSELDRKKAEEMKQIQNERDGWENERGRRMAEFSRDKQAIEEMRNEIQKLSAKTAEEAIRLYPFLCKAAAVEHASKDDPEKVAALASTQSGEFSIPGLLKSGCKGARISVDQQTFLSQLRDVAESEGLYYDPDDLRRFHTSVLCEGLTILAGPSGVGKSSLARLYGKVLSGNECAPRDGTWVVPVGPSWLERSDFLGYVNSVTSEFAPSETGVFQRLIYAYEDFQKNNGDAAIYPFCLDEMNLSQIEHYFSDFMQILEGRTSERKLNCFSAAAVKPDSQFYKYATLTIPPSVRFIGTVNFDETTRRMSSRLLDRVNLISLSGIASSQVRDNRELMGVGTGISYATYSSWLKTGVNLSAAAEKCLTNLAPLLRRYETAISPRVHEAMKRYIASTVPLIENSVDAEKIAFDEQIAQRVLSKIRLIDSFRQSNPLDDSFRQSNPLDEIEGVLSDYCGSSMTQSSRVITSLREQELPFDDFGTSGEV